MSLITWHYDLGVLKLFNSNIFQNKDLFFFPFFVFHFSPLFPFLCSFLPSSLFPSLHANWDVQEGMKSTEHSN